jgi:hypothetical protein
MCSGDMFSSVQLSVYLSISISIYLYIYRDRCQVVIWFACVVPRLRACVWLLPPLVVRLNMNTALIILQATCFCRYAVLWVGLAD